jgi:hypothetical protein
MNELMTVLTSVASPGAVVPWLIAGVVLAAALWVGIAEYLRRRAAVDQREADEIDVTVRERLARL